MGRLLLKLFVVFLLLLTLTTSVGLGYLYVQLGKERDALQDKMHKLNKRATVLQKKYGEEKSRTAGLARTKLTLEGKLRVAQGEIETLQKENELVLSEKKALSKKMKKIEKGSISLQAEIEEVTEKYAKLKTECYETKRKLGQRIKDCEEEKNRLTAKKQTLQSQLDWTNRSLARCESNNAKLCVIANELAEKYEDKGVVGSVFQKEPFLQFKKVEIEKFVQEYKEKIDEEQLKRAK
jgi:chromosome segregation ATPase